MGDRQGVVGACQHHIPSVRRATAALCETPTACARSMDQHHRLAGAADRDL
jgi:hypothetical protein